MNITLKKFLQILYPCHKCNDFLYFRFGLNPDEASADLFVRAGINVVLKDKSLVQVFHLDISVYATGNITSLIHTIWNLSFFYPQGLMCASECDY